MVQKILKLTVVLLAISFTFASKSTGKKQVVLNSAPSNDKLELLSTKSVDAIDQIFQLIQDLQSTSQSELDALNDNWTQQNSNFKESIQNALDVYSQYNDEICPALQSQFLSDQLDWQAAIQQQADAQAQTDANNQKIADLEAQRCQNLDDYSTRLSTNKDSLKLLQYLKDAITNFNYDNLSLLDKSKIKDLASTVVALAQKKNIKTDDKLTQILQLSSKQDQDQVHIRTAEEIGTDYIDSTGDAITVQKLDTDTVESLLLVKSKLLDLLDELISEIQSTMDADKQSQIDFYGQLSNQLLQLEAENRMLEKYLGMEWVVKIQGLFFTQSQSEQDYNNCVTESETYYQTVQDIQAQQQAAENEYNSKVANLSAQVNNFDQVKQLYQDGVAGAKDQYKQYIQDYVDDGSLDTTQQFEGRTQQSISDWEAVKNLPTQ